MNTYSVKYKDFLFKIAHEYKSGNTDLLVFIHGLGCSSATFKDALNCSALKHYSLLRYDHPGHGDSSHHTDFSYSMEDLAGIGERIINEFPGRKIHLVCHSMGGAIGLILAESISSRLVSFINIEGNLTGDDCTLSREIAVIHEDTLNMVLKNFIARMMNTGYIGDRHWAKWITETDPAALIQSSASLVKWSDSGRLTRMFSSLPCKKIYIYGDSNSGMRTLREIPSIRKKSISGSGHFPMLDNPVSFYNCLAELLKE